MGYGHSGLTFKALRGANMARLPLFKDAKGRRAHVEPDGSDWSNAQWLQAVVGELGELANLLKKIDRGDFTLEEVRPLVEAECADVQTYLDILAMRLGVDLGRATMEKFNVVSKRVGAGVRLEADDWFYDRELGRVPMDDDAGGSRDMPVNTNELRDLATRFIAYLSTDQYDMICAAASELDALRTERNLVRAGRKEAKPVAREYCPACGALVYVRPFVATNADGPLFFDDSEASGWLSLIWPDAAADGAYSSCLLKGLQKLQRNVVDPSAFVAPSEALSGLLELLISQEAERIRSVIGPVAGIDVPLAPGG